MYFEKLEASESRCAAIGLWKLLLARREKKAFITAKSWRLLFLHKSFAEDIARGSRLLLSVVVQ